MMPLVLWGAIAWVVGTATGLAGPAPGPVAVLLASAAVGLLVPGRTGGGRTGPHRTPKTTRAALLLVAATGAQLGAELSAADSRCRDEAARATRWEVHLLADVAPGAFARGMLRKPGCVVTVALAVRSGVAAAGSDVEVTRAESSGGEQGLLLREAVIQLRGGPGPLDRWRNAVTRRLDRHFGSDGPIVRALLIADTKGLSPELRQRYADAGLVHILSISGLHVAIVGGALLLLFQAVRLPAMWASACAVGVTVVYVLAIGAPPPAARSATLFAATTLTQALQRPVSPWGAFALGALVPLGDPRTVLDLGWQLSVSGYAAILVAARVSRRLPERWRGWKRAFARELVAGLLTTLVTAPLVAWHFGRLSLVSPLSNLVAGPVVSVLQPALFVAMLSPLAPLTAFVADAARPLLRALDLVASTSAAVPGAAVVVSPSLLGAVLAGVGACAVLCAGWMRHWPRPALVGVAATALLAWLPPGFEPRLPMAELHLLDVGQGDAIALRSPRGRWVVVDAGRAWTSGDAGRATVIPYLRRRGGAVAMLVLTHPHADHIGGAASVLRALKPAEVRDAAFVSPSPLYRDLLRLASTSGARWQRVRPGERVDIDGLILEFLAPDSAWTAGLDDPNEASTVLFARFGDVRMLLTGDAERGEEEWLLAHARGSLQADVLKVGHHGSSTSSTVSFVDAVAPRIALVSVGAGNSYGHPGADVIRRLSEAGATVLRTDQLGTVVVRTDGRSIDIDAGGHRWRAARPLPAMR